MWNIEFLIRVLSHQGGQSLRFVSEAPAVSFGANKSLWGLAGSASLRGKTLVVTVVNPHVSEPRTAEVSLRGANARSGRVTVLASPDIHAHNDFDNLHAIEPKLVPASFSGSSFAFTFQPASVTKLEIDLE